MLLRLLANAAALGVATLLLPGITLGGGSPVRMVLVLLAVALVFGIVNAVVKPIFTVVTLPVVLLSLGVFLLVINALMLWLTSAIGGWFGLGWHVDGFWNALFGALIISVVSFVLNAFIGDDRRRGRRRA
ncbi:phage holin family protein [Auraticoccus monumenti]|uniref:Putative membrane protein n=1 Tax=Auraticoccus monumenti TaxID=675864 RepID=A0A1G6SS47_9ACTN|nr:phage holin family protein [Auraticoccus monumenti]SDD19514.1 putative membrane protein [Auraticoccus monumenti]